MCDASGVQRIISIIIYFQDALPNIPSGIARVGLIFDPFRAYVGDPPGIRLGPNLGLCWIHLRPSETRDGGGGAFCTNVRPRGSLILSAPKVILNKTFRGQLNKG